MVLADSNIIIDYWNAPTDEVTKIFEREDVAIRYKISLMTNDHHFQLISSVIPELQLYDLNTK